MDSAKIVPLREDFLFPQQSTEHSAGIDLFLQEDLPIAHHIHNNGFSPSPVICMCLSLGFRIDNLPRNCWLEITNRSSNFRRGIDVRRGIIDSDYRGTIFLQVSYPINCILHRGERICQMVIHQKPDIDWEHVHVVKKRRGDVGLGSTGV